MTISNDRSAFIAKPGYGKSYLSTVIIDDLSQDAALDSGEVLPIVAFYHFSRAGKATSNTSSTAAMRALASQVVHALQREPAIYDSITFFLRTLGSGQRTASKRDAEHILAIAMRQYAVSFVIDGIDECDDSWDFLTTFRRSCGTTNAKALLLSRPDLVSPPWLRKDATTMMLLPEHNQDDIAAWLLHESQPMIDDGLFGPKGPPPNSLEAASSIANGIFLWARLFTQYISSPALTPRDRHDFLREALSFHGLDELYCLILRRLSLLSKREKATTAKIFRWIAGALYPIPSDVLHTALAVTPGVKADELDYLVNFPGCLPQLTGALAELDSCGRPAFIHLSAREFLLSERGQAYGDFRLPDQPTINQEIAIICISYLTHDVPRKPVFAMAWEDLELDKNSDFSSLGRVLDAEVDGLAESVLAPRSHQATLPDYNANIQLEDYPVTSSYSPAISFNFGEL